MSEEPQSLNSDADAASPAAARSRRSIPGNFPYTAAPGALQKALEKIPFAEKPSVFNTDFVETVLEVTGGSSRPISPILKTIGFLSQSGQPTELYAQFQTDGGRANAALAALRTGFAEIFKRNKYAHKADNSQLQDIIVSITGLPRSDPIVRSILNTFKLFQSYAANAKEEHHIDQQSESQDRAPRSAAPAFENNRTTASALGLVYNINIVLPETTNIDVYNTIFRSLRENLLQ